MKVLLKEDVENLGLAGEVHQVAPGYGRNYLIPRGYAIVATPGALNQATVWRKKAEARRAQIRAEHQALAEKINGVTLTFTARAGETGKLYGSITTAQVAEGLADALGIEVDRRKVGDEPLRQLGEHKVVVRLTGDIQPHVTVLIKPEGEEEMAAETAVAPETEEEAEEVAV
jgi:large subunit ribosomal protein L9